MRDIAGRYEIARSALHRHKKHVSDKLALAKQHEEMLSSESLLAEMRELKTKLRGGLDEAIKSGNAPGFVAFSRELRQTLETYFSISDRLAERKLTQASAGGVTLADRIAAGRQRLREAREHYAEDDNHLASLPAATLKSV